MAFADIILVSGYFLSPWIINYLQVLWLVGTCLFLNNTFHLLRTVQRLSGTESEEWLLCLEEMAQFKRLRFEQNVTLRCIFPPLAITLNLLLLSFCVLLTVLSGSLKNDKIGRTGMKGWAILVLFVCLFPSFGWRCSKRRKRDSTHTWILGFVRVIWGLVDPCVLLSVYWLVWLRLPVKRLLLQSSALQRTRSGTTCSLNPHLTNQLFLLLVHTPTPTHHAVRFHILHILRQCLNAMRSSAWGKNGKVKTSRLYMRLKEMASFTSAKGNCWHEQLHLVWEQGHSQDIFQSFKHPAQLKCVWRRARYFCIILKVK